MTSIQPVVSWLLHNTGGSGAPSERRSHRREVTDRLGTISTPGLTESLMSRGRSQTRPDEPSEFAGARAGLRVLTVDLKDGAIGGRLGSFSPPSLASR